MFSHVNVGPMDPHRLARCHRAALAPLGPRRREVAPDGRPPAACRDAAGGAAPGFRVYAPLDGLPASAGNGRMVALPAPSPEAVRGAHMAGLAAGGTHEGAPGERPRYGRGCRGAYLRDPEGKELHVVHRGDLAAGG